MIWKLGGWPAPSDQGSARHRAPRMNEPTYPMLGCARESGD